MAQYPLVIDDDLKTELENEAKHFDRSLNNYINRILKRREPVTIQTEEESKAALETQGGFPDETA